MFDSLVCEIAGVGCGWEGGSVHGCNSRNGTCGSQMVSSISYLVYVCIAPRLLLESIFHIALL